MRSSAATLKYNDAQKWVDGKDDEKKDGTEVCKTKTCEEKIDAQGCINISANKKSACQEEITIQEIKALYPA